MFGDAVLFNEDGVPLDRPDIAGQPRERRSIRFGERGKTVELADERGDGMGSVRP